MKAPFCVGIVYAACAGVAGCAAPGQSTVTTATAPPKISSPYSARDSITIGKSTKADVIDVLGKATVISFDSGFEVWAYKFKSDKPPKANWLERSGRADPEKAAPGDTELVVLFAPSGIVTKTRIREAPPPGEATGK